MFACFAGTSGIRFHIRCMLFCDETPPATERYLYIDQTRADDGRTGRFLTTGEDTFVDVYLLRRISKERRRHGLLRMGEAKKTLHPIIMACGAGHELTWNITGGETLRRRVITARKGYPPFRRASRAYQGYEATIYYYYYVLKQFRRLRQKNSTFCHKSKLKNHRNSRNFQVTKAHMAHRWNILNLPASENFYIAYNENL